MCVCVFHLSVTDNVNFVSYMQYYMFNVCIYCFVILFQINFLKLNKNLKITISKYINSKTYPE